MINSSEEYDKMIAAIEKIVNIDSGTYDKDGVDQVGNYLAEQYEALNFVVDRTENKEIGDFLTLRHKDAQSPEIIISAHLDTVFPKGTVEMRPFSIKEDRAYGPGVIDMKSSHIILLYAIKNLIAENSEAVKNIEIVLNSDEEIGSLHSKSYIESKCDGKKYGIVLEPARANGAIVSARRGTGRYKIEVHGKAAHAGINPADGRSAIEELAHKIISLQALTDEKENIHVNVGLIEGGTSTNSVADYASCEVDVRISEKEQAEMLEEKIRAIVEENKVEDVSATLSGAIRRLPMVYTEETEKFVNLVKGLAKELGFELKDVATGGGSDASFIANKGIATLDGLGPVGGKQHSPDEYLELDSLIERKNLLVEILKNLS